MVARQSSGPMKTNHAWIADNTRWLCTGMVPSCEDIFGVSPLFGRPWGIWCKLRLEEDSDENLPHLKVCVRLHRWSRIQNRRVVRKLQRRVKITPGIGFRVVRLLLQSSNLLSIDPGTFLDACLLGGGECLHNANNWTIRITTTRSATSLVFAICAFLQHSCQFKLIYFSLCMFMRVKNGDTESELSKYIVWNRRTCCQVRELLGVPETCRFKHRSQGSQRQNPYQEFVKEGNAWKSSAHNDKWDTSSVMRECHQ